MFFKEKFTVNPQLDSEGFVEADARCLGCAADAPCPRSGSCENYNSPIRITIGSDPIRRYLTPEEFVSLYPNALEVRDGRVRVKPHPSLGMGYREQPILRR